MGNSVATATLKPLETGTCRWFFLNSLSIPDYHSGLLSETSDLLRQDRSDDPIPEQDSGLARLRESKTNIVINGKRADFDSLRIPQGPGAVPANPLRPSAMSHHPGGITITTARKIVTVQSPPWPSNCGAGRPDRWATIPRYR